jgi:phosphatidylserine/phosphatidylglycerophosphate/cardiolipin synthase-like enzyme
MVNIQVTFLKEIADDAARAAQIKTIAQKLADFISATKFNLHIAIYDFRLDGEAADLVVGALNRQAENGIVIRLAYFAPKQKRHSTAAFAVFGDDPAPGPDHRFLDRLHRNIQVKPIEEQIDRAKRAGNLDGSVNVEGVEGGGHLMHDKYAVRDGLTPESALWTGSANFTDDAWGRQDNNILEINSQDLCGFYETDFAELWSQEAIRGTGKNDTGTAQVDQATISVAFSPGEGRSIDTDITAKIAVAKNSIAIASMVISSGNILGALVDAIDRGVELTGVYDGTEMRGVERAWGRGNSSTSAAKLAAWNTVKQRLIPKWSHPYTATGPHDFMHNKTVSIDGRVVVTGSFNFSLNATGNAENVLAIEDAGIAENYTRYIADLVKTYKGMAEPANLSVDG